MSETAAIIFKDFDTYFVAYGPPEYEGSITATKNSKLWENQQIPSVGMKVIMKVGNCSNGWRMLKGRVANVSDLRQFADDFNTIKSFASKD